MAYNAIELITKYSTEAWDKVYAAESRSAILDGNKDLIKFVGAKTVKIAKYSSTGLGNYHRPTEAVAGNFGGDGHGTGYAVGTGYGYPQGAASVTWEEFTIANDRAVQLRIDLFDDEETGGLAVAMATTEESRTTVIPEVDAYVFSKIVEQAGTIDRSVINYTSQTIGMGAQDGPIANLNKAFLELEENQVPAEEQVIFCSPSFFNGLRGTNELVRTLNQTEYSKNVKFTISEYEGRPIIVVPKRRFRTNIDLYAAGGYGWGVGSEDIDFIVCAKSAVYHVTKYDKVRVIKPEAVQDFDGYKVNVRVYHDVFVPDNKRCAIYVHTSGTPAVAPELNSSTLTLKVEGRDVKGFILNPGNTFVDGFYVSETGGITLGTAVESISDAVEINPFGTLPEEVSGTVTPFATRDGKVVAVGTAIAVAAA